MNREALARQLNQRGFMATEEQINQFLVLADILVEQNKIFNLTSLVEEEQIINKHFIDSLIGQKHIKGVNNIIDIGCGAGFPSLPLKIMFPQKEFFLIDSLKKRIDFVKFAIQKMGLRKIEVQHLRIEEAAHKTRLRANFDAVIARAVAPLNTLLEYAIPFLEKGGKVIAYKGEKVYDEIKQAEGAFKMLFAEIEEIEEYKLDTSNHSRYLLVIRKTQDTPKIYPRGKGKPRKQPL